MGSPRRGRRRRTPRQEAPAPAAPSPALAIPNGRAMTAPTAIASTRPVGPAIGAADADAERDVGGPEHARSRARTRLRRVEPVLADPRGEEHDPGGGESDPEEVGQRREPRSAMPSGPDELERDGDAERDPVDRLVEAEVHRHEHEPEREARCKLMAGAGPVPVGERGGRGRAPPKTRRSVTRPVGVRSSKSDLAIAAPELHGRHGHDDERGRGDPVEVSRAAAVHESESYRPGRPEQRARHRSRRRPRSSRS